MLVIVNNFVYEPVQFVLSRADGGSIGKVQNKKINVLTFMQ